MMRNILAAAVVGIALFGARAALGADAAVVLGGLPPGPPPYGQPPYGPPPFVTDTAVPTLFYFWNGLYIGGEGGWGWTTTKGLNASGDIGGGQLGYNYQTGNFVLGVEADGSFANITSHNVTIPFFGFLSNVVGYEANGLASLRARFGVATNGLPIPMMYERGPKQLCACRIQKKHHAAARSCALARKMHRH
jgi:hypothetical protein